MVVRSHEGREPVAPARVERTGARARGKQATHPGGVGAPPGGQQGLPARSVATGAGAFARLSSERRIGERIRPAPVKRGPNGAPEGAMSSQEGLHIRICRAAWRAVPSLRDEDRKRNK